MFTSKNRKLKERKSHESVEKKEVRRQEKFLSCEILSQIASESDWVAKVVTEIVNHKNKLFALVKKELREREELWVKDLCYVLCVDGDDKVGWKRMKDFSNIALNFVTNRRPKAQIFRNYSLLSHGLRKRKSC